MPPRKRFAELPRAGDPDRLPKEDSDREVSAREEEEGPSAEERLPRKPERAKRERHIGGNGVLLDLSGGLLQKLLIKKKVARSGGNLELAFLRSGQWNRNMGEKKTPSA